MTDKIRNIYYNARQAAGLTQERWTELLGVSPEAVRQYEAGAYIPADDVARRMAELAGLPVLGYWHLCRKSSLAEEILPEVERVSLPMAVCRLLAAMQAFTSQTRGAELLRIAADGRISALEAEGFRKIVGDLDEIVQAALQVKYARNEEEEG